jgi:hypothetical protein
MNTALTTARRNDSDRRRQRVLNAITQLAADGAEITVSAVARAAAVHRTFIYRHPDLHTAVSTGAEQPAADNGSAVSRRSLLTDLANLTERCARQTRDITRLEQRLSDALGESVWRATGLGAPDDVEALNRRIVALEQETLDLRQQLQERSDDLDAARSANRDLISRLNRT